MKENNKMVLKCCIALVSIIILILVLILVWKNLFIATNTDITNNINTTTELEPTSEENDNWKFQIKKDTAMATITYSDYIGIDAGTIENYYIFSDYQYTQTKQQVTIAGPQEEKIVKEGSITNKEQLEKIINNYEKKQNNSSSNTTLTFYYQHIKLEKDFFIYNLFPNYQKLKTEGTMSGLYYKINANISEGNFDFSKRGYYITTFNQPNAPYWYIITMGQCNSTGYNIEIVDLKIDTEKNVEIITKESMPGTNNTNSPLNIPTVGMAITYPTCCLELSECAKTITIKNTYGFTYEYLGDNVNFNNTNTEQDRFKILFYDKQPIDSYNLYTILNSNETEKYDYTIYGYDGIVKIIINDTEYLLKDALLQNKITIEEIIDQAYKDAPDSKTYNDGGTVAFYYTNYTIIKCNRLDGNKNVYIGRKGMSLSEVLELSQ